jgi:hypothetical protein
VLQTRHVSLSNTTQSSLDKLVVVFEFHYERADVLAISLPFFDALFSVAIEIFLLVV